MVVLGGYSLKFCLWGCLALANRADKLKEFFGRISEIRAFEEVVAEGYRDRKLPGLLHLSMGSEATAVGAISGLRANDKIYSSHRPHGHFLAAGTDPRSLMAELAGRESGLCRGRAGSMHLMDYRAMMATGIVGGTLSIALGTALVQGEGSITVVFFGDGAVQTGTFHETMNMAALWSAPILFVCENNDKIEFSSREEHTKIEHIEDYGRLYKMPAIAVNGCDVESVASSASKMADLVRSGGGPALLVCKISRLRPHYEGDLRQQESAEDPLQECMRLLVELGEEEESLVKLHESNISEARNLLTSVLDEEPLPNPADDLGLVYSKAC